MRFLFLGLSLGLGAGISPGPLFALVISTTLARGFRAGARVAFTPLITDTIIISVSLLLVHAIPTSFASLLGIAGGCYVVWLGIEALRTKLEQDTALTNATDPLAKGLMVNLLSPHPWLFWIVVGGPILLAAWAQSPIAAVAFLGSFFLILVGTKVVIAAIVAQGRERLSAKNLLIAQRVSGVLLIIAGVALAVEFAQQMFS
jgi:threonine/homoserine/homoserine lactone efflux protein